jgi:LacI family transcriptional regulator
MNAERRRVDHPTLGDVARLAGVSRATAARALGGYGRSSEEARRRVLDAADRLGYRPNTLARSMITGTTHTLGVVIADIDLSFFARAVRGIGDTARAAGFEVILANSDESVEQERGAVGVMLDKRVDGLIVSPAAPSDAGHLVDLVGRGLPLVLFDRGVPGLAADAVVIDNRAAGRLATDHLLALGHRRIAILVVDESAATASDLAAWDPGLVGAMPSRLRESGWAAALRDAGVAVTDELIWATEYDRDAARRVTAAALAAPDRPTAIIATDETLALGAIDAVLASGLAMPGDVSLVAFDDAAWTNVVRPPITVVAQPVYDLGVTAASDLIRRIRGDDSAPRMNVLPTSFEIRGSTGSVPAPRPVTS